MPQTSPASTLRVPAQGLTFSAPVTLAAADGADAKGRRFSGVAYGGGTITDHGWWDAVAFDLAGITAAAPMPVLLQHDSQRVIGVIEQVTNDGTQLAIAGRLFTSIDADADAVAAKADAGAPWQMSVGIFPDLIEQLPADGQGAVVNGRPVRAGASVFRRSRVRETSFVALGADSSTQAHVFNAAGEHVANLINPEPDLMADTDRTAELQAQITQLTADNAALKARAEAAEGKFAAQQLEQRKTAVKGLLGDSFSAEAAAPYLDMTDAQFAAAAKLAGDLRAKLPPGFTVEQAAQGLGADKPVTAAAITKYRRENPGATYEQAFAALNGVEFKAPTHF